MHCKDAQTLLDPWIDDELPAKRQKDLEHHLSTCRTCAVKAQELQEIKLCLDSHPPVLPSPDLKEKTMARFQEASGSRTLAHWWTTMGWQFQTAMTLGAVIGLGIGCRLGEDWTGIQLLNQYSISGLFFSMGDFLLSWA